MTPSAATSASRDFLALSRRLLDVLGPDGLGSESDQRQFVVDGIEPTWVLMPASDQETAEALRVCTENQLAVVPAGLGWRLDHGSPPERVDAVLSTLRMDSIVDHAAADMTITVRAGATLAAVNDALRRSGQWLPFDAPFPQETTIGGLVAANVSGPSRERFGTVRESLLGLRVVSADGTIAKSGGRVVKNVAGYDVHKLVVGSFGTLAVIVEATFKVRPIAESRALLSFASPRLTSLFGLARALSDSPAAHERLEALARPGHEPTLAVGIAGLAEEVEEARRRVATLAASLGVKSGDEISEAALGAFLETFDRSTPSAVVVRGGMPRSKLGAWLSAAVGECDRVTPGVTAHAHAGTGVARLRIDGGAREAVVEAVQSLRRQALAAGGYLVVERAPAAWKSSLGVWRATSAAFDLMKGIKAAFDPGRVLAPGRFVGGL